MDIKEQMDSVHLSPARQTEAFIISETEDDSRAGNIKIKNKYNSKYQSILLKIIFQKPECCK
jgi:hypothetical protein